MSLPKHIKMIQVVNVDKDIILNNDNILRCFQHFKERATTRNNAGYNGLDLENFYQWWILHLRGDFIKFDTMGRMYRSIGSYFGGPMYKIVYVRITLECQTFYVPLTIFEITDHKKKYHQHCMVVKNKMKYNTEK